MGFANNPLNVNGDAMDGVLVYLDDLFITSNSKKVLENISDKFICKYEAGKYPTQLSGNRLGFLSSWRRDSINERFCQQYHHQVQSSQEVPRSSNMFHRCCIFPPSTIGQEKSLSLMRHDGILSGKTFPRSPPSHFAHLNAYIRPRKTSRSLIESLPSFSIR
jgi:hypothetical protein